MHSPAVLAAAFCAMSASFSLGCVQQPPPPTAEAPPAATAQVRGGGVKQATVSPVRQLAQKKFGTAITESNNTSVASMLSNPSQYSAKTVRTEGVVSAVCQSMGCWMEITDESSGQAHIKMAGHSFFIPKDASGHRAVVQGRLLSAAGPACGSNDCNSNAATTGQLAQIEATGVEFVD